MTIYLDQLIEQISEFTSQRHKENELPRQSFVFVSIEIMKIKKKTITHMGSNESIKSWAHAQTHIHV